MLYSINDYQFAFCAPDGSEVFSWGRGEASDSAAKSSNKAVSVALKYVLLDMFLIPTEEMVKDEADAYTNELGTKPRTPAKPTPTYVRPEDISSAISLINTAKTLADWSQIWKDKHPTTKNAPVVRGVRCRADVIFPRERVAVFVDGCFWHSCPEHGVMPATNRHYWEAKLGANVSRDRRNDVELRRAGWLVVRVWEHKCPEEAATAIAEIVRSRRA